MTETTKMTNFAGTELSQAQYNLSQLLNSCGYLLPNVEITKHAEMASMDALWK